MKKVLFLKNAVILTMTSLILRTVGIFFRVWLADKIGAEGIGLYQVVFSVYVLASTFATSGISTAVTRMVAARLTVNDTKGALRTVKISVLLSLIIAFLSMAVIYLFADPISVYIIKDERATLSLKILCISLPFMGVCSCIRGYFLARRSTLPPSVCQIGEQIARIVVIIFLIGYTAPYGLAASSAAVIAGDSLSEVAGAFLLWLFYKADKKQLPKRENSKGGILKEIIRIAAPISGGRYLHTALRTAENLLTPICLSSYSSSRSNGLEQFGMIKGMALPILLFPASLLSSVSTLLVPEMTEAMEKNNKGQIWSAVDKTFYITSVFSFLFSGIFFIASGQIGILVYKSDSVSYLIRALAPLVPFMYVDLIADGILKGLDQQNILLRNNVIDSIARLILVIILVPKYGMTGFLGVMLFSNVFTGAMSVIRIVRVTGMKFDFTKYFWSPLFSAFVSAAATDKICSPLKNNPIWYIVAVIICASILYFVFLIIIGGKEIKRYAANYVIKFWKKAKKV